MNATTLDKKLNHWKNNLLDLTRRNRLLNFRDTNKSTLKITTPNITAVWKHIVVDEKSGMFLYPNSTESNVVSTVQKNSPFVLGTQFALPEQQKILQNLRSKAKIASDEQGINILYLAFGVVTWQESQVSQELYRAPIILVPVTLSVESIVDPYKLKVHEDEIVVNPTLVYKLHREYGLSIPQFDIENDSDIVKYFGELKTILRNLPGLNIVQEVFLSYFSFLKMNMYDDLMKHETQIKNHAIVRALIGDVSGLVNDSNIINITEYDHDATINPQDVFHVLDADSSQQDAVLRAKKGQSFVLQGPPGTGKSQTITNIIAESIAAGKKVLFVSEKVAALDVVHQRLASVQLADYCLVLHSHKTDKKKVLQQLEKMLDSNGTSKKLHDNARQKLQRLHEIRSELNQYVKEMNTTVQPLNKRIYDVYGYLAQLTDTPDVSFTIPNILQTSDIWLGEQTSTLQKLMQVVQKNNNDWSKNPWMNTNIGLLTNELRSDLHAYKKTICDEMVRIIELLDTVESTVSHRSVRTFVGTQELVEILHFVSQSPIVPVKWMDATILKDAHRDVNVFEQHSKVFFQLYEQIRTVLENDHVHAPDLWLPPRHEIISNRDLRAYVRLVEQYYQRQSCFVKWKSIDALQLQKLYDELLLHIQTIKRNEHTLLQRFEKEILGLDYMPIMHRFKTSYTSILKYLSTSYRYDYRVFKGLQISLQQPLNDDAIYSALRLLREIDESKQWIMQSEDTLHDIFSHYFAGKDTDIERLHVNMQHFTCVTTVQVLLTQMLDILVNFEQNEASIRSHLDYKYQGIGTDWDTLRSDLLWANALREQMIEKKLNARFVEYVCENALKINECATLSKEIVGVLNSVTRAFTTYISYFDNNTQYFDTEFAELISWMDDSVSRFDLLADLIEYRRCINVLSTSGLKDYTEQVLQHPAKNNIAMSDIVGVFRKRYFLLWLDQVLPNFPIVQKFRHDDYHGLIQEFKNLDVEQLNIASQKIRIDMHNNHIHSLHGVTGDTGELGVLNREIKKQKRLKPIRKLFGEIPKLLLKLKPCLMMSPLSVSMFLESDAFQFDIVIFDEASQVLTENAIGAIFRGTQVIIAGDSKQLPPTNFFNVTGSSTEDDDDDTDIGDFESILDEAGAMPQHTLLWHYRSKHEHLITFSNVKFYRNKLITFPSSIESDKNHGVEFEYVTTGVYDRAGKGGNRIEAERVAELVFEHFAHSPNRSLGVIAFGEAQQQAIESAVRKIRLQRREFEQYFVEGEEAFFVKNLENVQGDERDTIIFSVGYAKDDTGKFLMNFGPLNRVGGERRLNVAVTRAKHNLKLVSSILPEEIDVSRVSSEGPKLLRQYLDYAMKGPHALIHELSVPTVVEHDSPFEESVYNFLSEQGYELSTQVGCSGYRIDMAVKDPTMKGRFLIGIECDGAMYHSTRTARERDRLRQTILESMGWNIYRVWSTDWINNPKDARARLLSAVSGSKKNGNQTHNLPSVQTQSYAQTVGKPVRNSNPYNFREYIETPLKRTNSRIVVGMDEYIQAVIDQEYPIHFELLVKRVHDVFLFADTLQIATQKVQMVVTDMKRDKSLLTKDEFLYPYQYKQVIPQTINNTRSIGMISMAEISVAMLKILEVNLSMTRDELMKETSTQYEFKRRGPHIQQALTMTLDYLLSQRSIKESNGRLNIN